MAYLSGKQAFLQILRQEGVSVMFGNPGTTELPLMDGLAREPGIRYVLTLQEAVAIAMASGGLGAVNVHVSPGLGNAMGMLYDAHKAVPRIDFVGLARSLGVPGEHIDKAADVGAAVGRGLASGGPYLLDVTIDAAFK